MKYIKSASLFILTICIMSSVSFGQEMGTMKKDSMKASMNEEGMKKDMMDKKDGMMKKDNMMKEKEMMHGSMMKFDKNMDGVAIKGYDPVGYFTDGKAEMGDKMYSHKWMGAEWHFKNKEHLNMFMENPEKYAPKYGGYCAYGVSKNHLSATDPNAWTIVDGKLYLNYNKDVQKMFNGDLNGNIMEAEKNWPELNGENEM